MEIETAKYGSDRRAASGRFDPATDGFANYRPLPDNPGSLANNIGAIYQDRSGVLWLGSWGGALSRFEDTSKIFVNYTPDPRDPHRLNGGGINSHPRRPNWNIVAGSLRMDCTDTIVKTQPSPAIRRARAYPAALFRGFLKTEARQALAQHQEGDIPVRSQDGNV